MPVTGLCCACGGSSDEPGPSPQPNTTEMVEKKYKSTEETFPNPESGFYTEIEADFSRPVSESSLRGLRSAGKSLVQLLYYVGEYNDKDFPAAGLEKLNSDFQLVRTAGLKVILRFAYTNRQDGADAPMDVILRHLDQLKPVLGNNKDVIACAQAGFIGAWGEWYYSSNGLNNTASYNQLIGKWLEVLPSDRCVQVRTPKYKQDYLSSTVAISESQAYNGTAMARIAHHNDAFMADEWNMGTYIDVAKDKAYVSAEGLYLPVGGETCRTSSTATPSSGTAALSELRLMRWSFLNDAYDRVVLNQWEKDGVMTEIRQNLGYRIILTRGEFSAKHQPGTDLTVRLSLQNVGFSAMYNPRDVKLVLRSADGKNEWEVKLSDDPRTWKPLRPIKLDATVALPADIPAGDYQLFLWLPDVENPIAHRAEYAVRLANQDVWEASTGYNDLGVTVSVASTGNLKQSNSGLRFSKSK